jgi:hypothetical protein
MKIEELLNKNISLGKVIDAAMKAKATLSSNAEHVIDAWQKSSWDLSKLQTAYSSNAYPELKQEIDHAFAPVRNVLKSLYGNTIHLYRGETDYDRSTMQNRTLYSWTATPQIAKKFTSGKKFKEFSDQEIKNAVDQYNRTGYTKFNNQYYVRDKNNPEYYIIYDRHKQEITDGDDLEHELRDEQNERRERNAAYEKNNTIYEADVPIDDIIWITNDVNCKEFICKYRPY